MGYLVMLWDLYMVYNWGRSSSSNIYRFFPGSAFKIVLSSAQCCTTEQHLFFLSNPELVPFIAFSYPCALPFLPDLVTVFILSLPRDDLFLDSPWVRACDTWLSVFGWFHVKSRLLVPSVLWRMTRIHCWDGRLAYCIRCSSCHLCPTSEYLG